MKPRPTGTRRPYERVDGVLIFDDSIEEKPYTDENELICWHYDHSKERTLKGINFLTALYHSGEVSLPVAFQLIAKTETYIDTKSGKSKRRSPKTKNEYDRDLLTVCVRNQLRFRYVLNDSWYASVDHMKLRLPVYLFLLRNFAYFTTAIDRRVSIHRQSPRKNQLKDGLVWLP